MARPDPRSRPHPRPRRLPGCRASRRGDLGSGGSYGPGAPRHGFDYVVPVIDALLGHRDMLGLEVTTVIPELTMAPHAPAPAELLPEHEASMANAHDRARELAATIVDGAAAA